MSERLGQLEERHLVYAMKSFPGRWAFSQQVIQEVAYSGLEPEAAAQLHLKAARALLADPRYQAGASDARASLADLAVAPSLCSSASPWRRPTLYSHSGQLMARASAFSAPASDRKSVV